MTESRSKAAPGASALKEPRRAVKTPAPSAPVSAPPGDGRVRAVIDALSPVVDGGRFRAKRLTGEPVCIEAHCFTDGHDKLRVALRWRRLAVGTLVASENEIAMRAQGDDVWTAEFTPPAPGRYRCTVIAWVDHFESWRKELERRDDLADIRVALEVGAALVAQAAARAQAGDASSLAAWSALLQRSAADPALADPASLKALALDPAKATLAVRYTDRRFADTAVLEIHADRKRAAFSSWYELFPRSAAPETARHGNFEDVAARLPYIAEMGFDVLYFPPIQPIGRLNRKGRNNALVAQSDDVGSPWAIGSGEGGHKAILPQLGSLEEFRDLVAKARDSGIEV